MPAADALAALAERGRVPRSRPPATPTWSTTASSRLATQGTGARRQRQAFERSGDLRDVVADLVARTAEAAAE